MISRRILLILSAAFFSCISPSVEFTRPAEAGVLGGYVPPPQPRRIQGTEAGGSRGGECSAPTSLSLLVPNDHVGLTVSSHPTFLWYLSEPTSAPMRFTLVKPGVIKPFLTKEFQVDKPGIFKLEIPQDAPELVEGDTYVWTVTIICNKNRPSENIFARGWIARSPNTFGLQQLLTNVTSGRERAGAYAQSGIWYDAVAAAYQSSLPNPQERSTFEYFSGLLDQVGLSNVALTVNKALTSSPAKP